MLNEESIMQKKEHRQTRKWVTVAAATAFVLVFSLVFSLVLTLPSFSYANAFASSQKGILNDKATQGHSPADEQAPAPNNGIIPKIIQIETTTTDNAKPSANPKTSTRETAPEPFIKPKRAVISTPWTTSEPTSTSNITAEQAETEGATEASKEEKTNPSPTKNSTSKTKQKTKTTKATTKSTADPTSKPATVVPKATSPATPKPTSAPKATAVSKETAPPETTKSPTEKPTEAPKSPGGSHHKSSADDFIKVLNDYRAAEGKSPLKKCSNLTNIACKRAVEISTNFSHEGIKKYGSYGENIFKGSGSDQYYSASLVLGRFKASSGHNTNQLYEKYKSVGVGHYITDKGTHCWAVVFGF